MGNFSFDGSEYDTENLTQSQKKMLASLTFLKSLTRENFIKGEIKKRFRTELMDQLTEEFGSKIRDIDLIDDTNKLTLDNGSVHILSDLEEHIEKKVRTLSLVDLDIIEITNTLQILDTAKITYSKQFSESLKP